MVQVNGHGFYQNLLNLLCVSIWLIVSFDKFFFFSVGKVLIFVTRKDNCAELAKNLKENGFTGKLLKK